MNDLIRKFCEKFGHTESEFEPKQANERTDSERIDDLERAMETIISGRTE